MPSKKGGFGVGNDEDWPRVSLRLHWSRWIRSKVDEDEMWNDASFSFPIQLEALEINF